MSRPIATLRDAAAHRDAVTVTVNGTPADTAATTLAELVAELGFGDARVATAVDGEFVPAAARATCRILPGAEIEIVAPRQGG